VLDEIWLPPHQGHRAAAVIDEDGWKFHGSVRCALVIVGHSLTAVCDVGKIVGAKGDATYIDWPSKNFFEQSSPPED
jgi:hypothetical protein